VKLPRRCIATVFMLLIISKMSIAGQERTEELRNAGFREYHVGNFTAAKALFKEALESAVSSRNKGLEGVLRNDLGNVELGVDRPETAYDDYARALSLFRDMPDKHFEIAATLRNLASAAALQKHFDEAQMFLTEAKKTLDSDHSVSGLTDSQLLMAEVLNSQGIIFLEQGKLGKAQLLFENAIRTRAAAGAKEELGDAQTLSNLGVIYRKQHKYMEAERAFLQSIDITGRTLGASHPDLTITLANLAEFYTTIGRYEDAHRQLERCLTILRGLDQPLNDRMARTLDLYAELLQKQGRGNDARDLRADARRIRLENALTVRAKNTE
jgi:tetratricopeptide (TPR) repeat protein